MARLDRAIHAFGRAKSQPRILGVDGRVKHGHDGMVGWVIGHDGWYKKRFQPAHGTEFEIDSVPTIEAKTKGFIVRAVISAALVALVVTGIYGLFYQKYGPLVSTWAVVGPIVGAMITHYFGGHRKDSG